MGSWRNEKPENIEDNIFANNPFLEDLLEWRDSPEGQQYAEFADVLCDLMEGVDLDAAQRRFIWPDGERLNLDQSAAYIHKQYPDAHRDWIEEYLIGWIETGYAPEHYSQAQLDELDRLTAQWVEDHVRPCQDLEKTAQNSLLLRLLRKARNVVCVVQRRNSYASEDTAISDLRHVAGDGSRSIERKW